MVDRQAFRHLTRQDADHGHGNTNHRRRHSQDHHVPRPQQTTGELPAGQRKERRAATRAEKEH